MAATITAIINYTYIYIKISLCQYDAIWRVPKRA